MRFGAGAVEADRLARRDPRPIEPAAVLAQRVSPELGGREPCARQRGFGLGTARQLEVVRRAARVRLGLGSPQPADALGEESQRPGAAYPGRWCRLGAAAGEPQHGDALALDAVQEVERL